MTEELSKEDQRKVDKFMEYMDHQSKLSTALKPFFESYPLYKKLRFKEHGLWNNTAPSLILIHCPRCKAERPFRYSIPMGSGSSSTDRFKGKGLLSHVPRHTIEEFNYYCAACPETIRYWAEINNREKWIWKVGQLPMWLVPVPKDIEKELGEDAELYQKALRNMNEGYGIGACAYLRRLLEKYINPLLELLYEVKKDQGASEEELADIKTVIGKKDFTTKTEYAAEIAPASIMVEGFNPLKEIHNCLSVGIHVLNEEKANEYATAVRDALEFVIRRLRREHEERKAYAEKLRNLRKLTS